MGLDELGGLSLPAPTSRSLVADRSRGVATPAAALSPAEIDEMLEEFQVGTALGTPDPQSRMP
jgi:hypothetical protein